MTGYSILKKLFQLVGLVLCSLIFLPFNVQASVFDRSPSSQFVAFDQVVNLNFTQKASLLTLHWQIGEGYYLYRQKLELVPKDARLNVFILPKGLPHHDEFFGDVEIYKNHLDVVVPIYEAANNASVRVTYQGCADAGFCYPPETREVPLNAVTAPTTNRSHTDPTEAKNKSPTISLLFSPLWALVIGIGMAFTPCVLPMYPLISSLILGRERPQSIRRVFLLSTAYVQGMALTYTLLGIAVVAVGLQFQVALQSPLILIGLSMIFIVLSLSMFGLFNLQLPSALQTRLALLSNEQRNSSMLGVFVMGALAGLICSPCTTAPLSAILLYIAQSGDAWIGAATLYLYALGMGLPLIAITLFGHRLMPRSGPWMHSVKQGFGFVILALPVFVLERVVGDTWGLRLWSLLGVTFFGWAFLLCMQYPRGIIRFLQLACFVAALIAARPLQDWAVYSPNGEQTGTHSLNFIQVGNTDQLKAALQQAHGRRVMLDLYADWCVACKEFNKYTFTAPQVQNALHNTLLLQIDVTKNSAPQAALLKRLNVLGLPTIMFFGPDGKELVNARVTGYMNSTKFIAHLQKIQL